jgi:hypothetical protein
LLSFLYFLFDYLDAPSRFKAPLKEKKNEIDMAKKAIQAIIEEALHLKEEILTEQRLYDEDCRALAAIVTRLFCVTFFECYDCVCVGGRNC